MKVRTLEVIKFTTAEEETVTDQLAVEAPLEIRLGFGPGGQRREQSLAVTMRTPGADFDLVRGFLLTEGIIGGEKDVLSIRHLANQLHPEARENVVLVELHPKVPIDFARLNRHFYTSSSCGVCGKTSIEMVQTVSCFLLRPGKPVFAATHLRQLPRLMRQAQPLFSDTGGIHAAALFDVTGKPLAIREDVGRHNAVDKVIGWAMQEGKIPLRDQLLLVSGRAGFELVQKALMAGIPVLAAVGAPSSLAVELAEESGMTIVGFLRDNRFNVYCGKERIKNL